MVCCEPIDWVPPLASVVDLRRSAVHENHLAQAAMRLLDMILKAGVV